jgi:hypothetical protein
MRNSKYAFKRLAIALGALLLVSAIGVAQVAVTLPSVTAKVGTNQSIPITVGDLTGKGVVSYQFTITYNPAIVTITGVTAGPLATAFGTPTFGNKTPGQVTVTAAGTTALSGSGILVYLAATMAGKGTTPLAFNGTFQFNEGTPAVTAKDGSVIVPVLSVKISDITTLVPVGSTFTLPITTESVTGLNVTSAQFTITWDKTKINITGVDKANTMTAAWTSSTNTGTGGSLTWAGAGQTALTSTGTLVNLTGTILALGGSSPVQFLNFMYNEGTPAAGGVDGSVTLGTPQKPVLVSRVPAQLTAASQNNIIAFTTHASDPGGSPITYSWKLNDALVKGPGADSTYSVRFTDPHGTAKKVSCIFTNVAGLTDSTVWSFIVTGVVNPISVPTDFVLGQNYPNPFNPTTLISYSLPKEAPVTFEVYNMLGVKVRTLMSSETRSAGTYTVSWDGRNDSGVGMPSGVYMYRVLAGTYMASKKMTLLK